MRVNMVTALAAIAVACSLMVVCQKADVPSPTTPEPLATPALQTVTPTAITPAGGGMGDTWTQHGVTVTVVRDEWGPGACHTSGGGRTLRIENNSDTERHSRAAAYTDPRLTCATQDTLTGKPRMEGPTHVAPGQTVEVTYHVQIPECGSLQADDCWGPGGLNECVFVIGDAFKSTEACEECVEGPIRRTSECGEWNKCHEQPETEDCWQEKECVETTHYQCKDPETREYEEKQTCVCGNVCVEEGPYEGEVIWDPTVHEGRCPATAAALTGSRCHQNGKRTTTWDCKDPTGASVCRNVTCPTPPPCVIPPEGTTLSWSGAGDPDSECAAFGPYEATWWNPDFYICKAGNDRIVEYSPPGARCDNGKERSHTTKCECVDD